MSMSLHVGMHGWVTSGNIVEMLALKIPGSLLVRHHPDDILHVADLLFDLVGVPSS